VRRAQIVGELGLEARDLRAEDVAAGLEHVDGLRVQSLTKRSQRRRSVEEGDCHCRRTAYWPILLPLKDLDRG
jgi:hypothetical protein